MPAGRPTKYKPEMCKTVIACGEQGMGKAEMAKACKIAYSSFDLWTQEIPEFSEAVKEGIRRSQAWWEMKGRDATFDAQGFSATSYIFQMKNRFRDDWRDRQEVEVTQPIDEEALDDAIARKLEIMASKGQA